MTIDKLFSSIEQTFVAQFNLIESIKHQGDKGENREEILRNFLINHLPSKYGITKGEVIGNTGYQSPSIDIIIYDAINCPILYAEKTAILPIEGVYGIIEVKSKLSKKELCDTAKKIKLFKENIDKNITYRICNIQEKPSLPFGIIFAYDLDRNSIKSLFDNLEDFEKELLFLHHNVNLIVVLQHGLIYYYFIDYNIKTNRIILSSDDIHSIYSKIHLIEKNIELTRMIEYSKENTFGKFFIYLLGILGKMKLCIPNIDNYYNPRYPIIIW